MNPSDRQLVQVAALQYLFQRGREYWPRTKVWFGTGGEPVHPIPLSAEVLGLLKMRRIPITRYTPILLPANSVQVGVLDPPMILSANRVRATLWIVACSDRGTRQFSDADAEFVRQGSEWIFCRLVRGWSRSIAGLVFRGIAKSLGPIPNSPDDYYWRADGTLWTLDYSLGDGSLKTYYVRSTDLGRGGSQTLLKKTIPRVDCSSKFSTCKFSPSGKWISWLAPDARAFVRTDAEVRFEIPIDKSVENQHQACWVAGDLYAQVYAGDTARIELFDPNRRAVVRAIPVDGNLQSFPLGSTANGKLFFFDFEKTLCSVYIGTTASRMPTPINSEIVPLPRGSLVQEALSHDGQRMLWVLEVSPDEPNFRTFLICVSSPSGSQVMEACLISVPILGLSPDRIVSPIWSPDKRSLGFGFEGKFWSIQRKV